MSPLHNACRPFHAVILVAALLFSGVARADLPTGWTNSDIGFPTLPGITTFTNGTWTISGAGTDICSTDQFQFAWTQLKGDGALIARLTGMTNGSSISKAGIVIRANTNAGAPQALVLANPTYAVRFNWRSTQDGTCGAVALPGLTSFNWLKLLRVGDTFSGFFSPDGTNWTQLGSPQVVPMDRNVLAGLAVSSRSDSLLCTATFSDVSFAAPPFGIYREAWTGLSPSAGDSLAALTNTALNPNWPDKPDLDSVLVLSSWQTQTNTGMSYFGERMRAFVLPPADGDYRFWIASRNTSELWLSTDESTTNAQVVARVTTFAEPSEWAKEAGQQSSPVHLNAGRRYYLESRVQHSTGVDHLEVRWQLPNGMIEEPLAAYVYTTNRLIPYTGIGRLPGIYVQPTNTTVAEGQPATFWMLVTNQCAVAYQWQLNGTNLSGEDAKRSVYTIQVATVPLNTNHFFTCVASTSSGSVTSAPAVVNVVGDAIPPVLLGASYETPTNVLLRFSEPLDLASATDITHYTFTNGLVIQEAVLSEDGQSVTLTTEPMQSGIFYTVILNGVRDNSYAKNPVALGTSATYFGSIYTPESIGNPLPPGGIAGVGDSGFDLRGGGKDIGGTTDQFQFAWHQLSGDFDIRVRLQSLSQTDAYAKAGLMARQDLSAASSFAGVFSTPTIGGSYFSYRPYAGGKANAMGSAPVNFPENWLRLQRIGDLFTGFASFDGQAWQQLGSVSLALTNPIYFGLAVSSHTTNVAALAAFRDLSNITNAQVARLVRVGEPIGPCSRRTGLAFTEIMYHPAERGDGRRLEFVELMNTQPFFEDISGYSISGDISFTFPEGTILPSGACVVVAKNPTDMSAVYGLDSVAGPYANDLSNGSGTVRLRNKIGAVLLEVRYRSVRPWPEAADGTGHSLVLARPTYGEGDPRAWTASDRKGGSPGIPDPVRSEPGSGVVINEFLAHTDPPAYDTIELFNRGTNDIDVSGYYLSDTPTTNKFRIPDHTTIGGRGFLAFDEAQLGFRLDAAGEAIYLVNPANTKVIDAVRFEGQENGVSSGRYPDGEDSIVALSTFTPGSSNTTPLRRDVVINEIMYHPISGNDDDQYVELYNRGTGPVNVGGWRFNDGISFTFPAGTTIPQGGYLVVARDADRMRSNYANLNAANLVGDFNGTLSGRGERLVLSMPDQILSTNQYGLLITNTIYIVENEVTYGTGGRWGQWSDGGGSSLELIDPHSDNSLAPNWADSDETAKAPWTTVDFTGVLDNGGGYAPDQLHVILQGAGECLVDNVEVLKVGSTNRIRNSTFDADAANWVFQGTHRASGYESTGGYAGGGCLHVRASGRGDTGANRIRTAIAPALAGGDTATIRGKLRWLKGNPEILLRLHGNYLEAAQRLNLPANPGTPGAQNSRFITNLGPAISGVAHAPVLPAITDPITVSAHVSDPDGVRSVTLFYRNDTASSPTSSLPMKDDGTDGDAFAGDGIFTAIIPAPGAKGVFAFYIQATDNTAAQVSTLFPNDAPKRECLFGTGETVIPGTLGCYRTWVTKANVTYWASREKNSNDPIDASFAYGDYRVVYNMRTLYSGSPFHTGSYTSPVGNPCDYVLNFPDDDLMLGATDYVIATLGNLNSDPTAQAEQAAFWIMDEMRVPTLHRRHVTMFVNGGRRGTVLEDAQQPSSDIVDEFFPDDNEGQLHKIEDWFEFDAAGSGFVNTDATLDNFTTTGGVKKTARYRWAWRPRAVKGSANDFTNLFQLVDALALNKPDPYTHAVEGLVDVEEWMRVLAVERLVGNWDSFSYQRGKNMYAYKPESGRWALLPWDIDFVLGLGDSANSDLWWGQDYPTYVMRNHPPFARAYWRAFYDAANGPLLATRSTPVLDAKYAALQANGINVTPPTSIKSYIAQRRTYLLSQLANVAATFSVSSPTVSGNLLTLSGTAPVNIKTILFSGTEYPVTWNSVTGWTVSIPLHQGLNTFPIVGLDSRGFPVAGGSNYFQYVYNPTSPSPTGQVVINELMVKPNTAGAEFVELYNNSKTNSFDLSGWRINGLDYTFPDGSFIQPSGFLVLTKDRKAFNQAYGLSQPPFDTFNGSLQEDGETLTLLRPGGPWTEVAKVRYEGTAPFPAVPGESMQLVDSRQDNWRAGNWSDPGEPQWQYFSTTGTASSSTLYVYLQSAGDVYIDDLIIVSGSDPTQGVNLLADGDFESGFPGPWTVSANHSGSALSTMVKRSGSASLHLVASSGGSTQGSSVWQTISPALTQSQPYSLSFWYLPAKSTTTLTVRLSGSGVTGSVGITPAPTANPLGDPGFANGSATQLPAFPQLWINELQVENLTGITNKAGARAPWIEIHNPTASNISLAGLYLSTNYTNLTQWAFPAGAQVKAGEFKVVFADGRTDLSTTNELHTSFTPVPGTGGVALSRLYQGRPQVLDYVNYRGLTPDRSYGSLPDGQSFDRSEFYFSTPGGTNNGALAPIHVLINEWMADNTFTLPDPVDGDYEDWFELYNADSSPANLGGYFLTDSATNRFLFEIPDNGQYVIPPKGFLLVWADGEPGQNGTNTPDLHANFKLSKSGESIGLYGRLGEQIDLVSFGPQASDASMGRSPDGSASLSVLNSPTPRRSNSGLNNPPTFSQPEDLWLYVGQTFSFALQASDPDQPGQTLTYSLPGNPVANASVNPQNGIVTWAGATRPLTNTITTAVTDNGNPPLTATRPFTVRVVAPPVVDSTLTPNNSLTLTVDTLPGQVYQWEVCSELARGIWIPAGAPVVGTGERIAFTGEISPSGQFFYRLQILR